MLEQTTKVTGNMFDTSSLSVAYKNGLKHLVLYFSVTCITYFDS